MGAYISISRSHTGESHSNDPPASNTVFYSDITSIHTPGPLLQSVAAVRQGTPTLHPCERAAPSCFIATPLHYTGVEQCSDIDALPAHSEDEKWASLFEVIAPYQSLCRVPLPEQYSERAAWPACLWEIPLANVPKAKLWESGQIKSTQSWIKVAMPAVSSHSSRIALPFGVVDLTWAEGTSRCLQKDMRAALSPRPCRSRGIRSNCPATAAASPAPPSSASCPPPST